MKKKVLTVAAVLLTMGLLAGCSNPSKPLHEMNVEKYVTLGDYQAMADSVTPPEVDEEELLNWLATVYFDYADPELAKVNRPVQNGDTANISYVGKKDGVAFEGGTADGADLTIGSGMYIAGFEEGLVGVKPGETVDLDLTFPVGYDNKELAGQAVVFTVTVNYIIPGNEEDMKDEVVAAMEIDQVDVSSVAELKQYLYELLVQDGNYEYINLLANRLVLDNTFTEFPDELVDNYTKIVQRDLDRAAALHEVTPEGYTLYFHGLTLEQYMNKYLTNIIKRDLALQAIANREGLTVSDEELEASLQQAVEEGGYASAEEFLGVSTKEDYRTQLMSEKVYEFLMK